MAEGRFAGGTADDLPEPLELASEAIGNCRQRLQTYVKSSGFWSRKAIRYDIVVCQKDGPEAKTAGKNSRQERSFYRR